MSLPVPTDYGNKDGHVLMADILCNFIGDPLGLTRFQPKGGVFDLRVPTWNHVPALEQIRTGLAFSLHNFRGLQCWRRKSLCPS